MRFELPTQLDILANHDVLARVVGNSKRLPTTVNQFLRNQIVAYRF